MNNISDVQLVPESTIATKVIFLDFDGVISLMPERPDIVDLGRLPPFNKEAVARLNQICLENDAEVVVSSSWRLVLTEEQIVKRLKKAGFIGKLHQDWATPEVVHAIRGDEIKAWLKAHREDAISWVILDDDNDFYSYQPLVQTQGQLGLEDLHVPEACRLLRIKHRM